MLGLQIVNQCKLQIPLMQNRKGGVIWPNGLANWDYRRYEYGFQYILVLLQGALLQGAR